MDDLWGDDDLDADVVEECVLLATQASYCSSPKPQPQRQQHSFIENKPKYGFEFKQPSHQLQINVTNQKTAHLVHSSTESNCNSNSNVTAKLVDVAELELLKEENRRLCETNLMKNGESTILRTDLQSVRAAMEKREIEVSHQLASLKEKVIHMDTQYSKQLEASKTEMKFKELELEELRNKCKKIEQSAKEHQKNKTLPISNQESPNRRKFLNRSSFEMAKYDAKTATIETGIQTEPIKRFRLDSTGTELGMDNATDTSILIETLKFSLLSSMYNNAISYSTVMEQLKLRMISGGVQENLIDLFHSSEPGIAEMICSNLERVKNADILKSNIEFLCCWITHILPFVENPKRGRLIEILLSEIRRISFIDMMSLLSAIVARFGLATVCNRQSGCLLEKTALNLKDSYLSLNTEDKFQAAQKLVLTISTMLASPASENSVKKCLCIPHLLKSLVFVVHHQIEVDGLTPHAAERRLKMLVQAFRLSLGILSSRREPWLTYKHSSAEVNRLYTVLTAISVEFHVPKEISHEINVLAFTLPGFGL
ncbi:uncharacterized protein LOC116931082 isoform X1 [Daphnia magna]|uniref:uncharacterized protein LOC116931082 isoform X1 n=1 Tax=Daphnia magna TaxID=35525 RepID=UPI001E1BBBBC|nr:uncharacterized protein LOC116931082 isoform X1 [Daphnia magna]